MATINQTKEILEKLSYAFDWIKVSKDKIEFFHTELLANESYNDVLKAVTEMIRDQKFTRQQSLFSVLKFQIDLQKFNKKSIYNTFDHKKYYFDDKGNKVNLKSFKEITLEEIAIIVYKTRIDIAHSKGINKDKLLSFEGIKHFLAEEIKKSMPDSKENFTKYLQWVRIIPTYMIKDEAFETVYKELQRTKQIASALNV